MLVVALQALVAFAWILHCKADPVDWANTNYVINLRKHPTEETKQAAATILKNAVKAAKGGPWSVTTDTIRAPSGDPKDYLSWAPYRWPDCSSCNDDSAPDDDREDSDDDVEEDDEPQSKQSKPKTTLPLTRRDNSTLASLAFAKGHIFNADDVAMMSPPLARFEAQVLATKATPTTSCSSRTRPATPEATWTTCPYIRRDGEVNPDVRWLNDSTFANKVVTSAVSNAIAFALSGDTSYSNVASLHIDTFLADPELGMNPNLNYGQVVRGPGKQVGSFMAVLDLRGMVKIVNAVEILRQAGAPQWTYDRDSRLVEWATSYIDWLKTNSIAQQARKAANNHGSFFATQMTSLQILVGDLAGARQTLRDYFSSTFPAQVVASGDQPFESSRTRPSHYRSFNLEAIIANAKLADHLGLDAWRAVSNYNITLQKALDYTMTQAPRSSEGAAALSEVAPHVAAVMAAYGDPTGKYTAWLKRYASGYQSKAWWLWDQPGAFAMSPVARAKHQQQQPLSTPPTPPTTAKKSKRRRRRGTMVMNLEAQRQITV